MIAGGDLADLITSHGIAILAPLAVIEGPIVTVIAAYLARQGLLVMWQVVVCVIVADLAGDVLHYAAGRGMLGWLPDRTRARLGLTDARMAQMASVYETQGARVLIVAKLTHAAGFAALIGAGAARMPLGAFLLANLVAAVPKSLFFIAIGYLFGGAHDTIGAWLSIGSGVVLLVLGGVLVVWLRRRKATP